MVRVCEVLFPARGGDHGRRPSHGEGRLHGIPHVDYVTGLHVMPTHETGEIEIRYGDLNASSDEIHIKVHGKSCHGAYPDTGVDAIVMAAAVINSLQTLVSRCISPLDSAVLTLGTIHGGTAGNIVAAETEMTGTLRTTDPAVREKILTP